jgi:hypothetical protein
MGLLDKAKAAAEQATTMAKEGAHELQLKRDLSGEFSALGKLAFELYEAGDLTHPKLEEKVERIRSLQAELARGNGQVEPVADAAVERPPAESA